MAKAHKKKIKRKSGSKKSPTSSTRRKHSAVLKIQRATRKNIDLALRRKKALSKINRATRKLKKKQENCAICLEKIDKKERTETNCGHFFHQKCINDWCLQKVKEKKSCQCPICKKNNRN